MGEIIPPVQPVLILIDTDDLLLGMLSVRGALAVEILTALGATPEAVRANVLAFRAEAS